MDSCSPKLIVNKGHRFGKAVGLLKGFFSVLRNKHCTGRILALNVRLQLSVDVRPMEIALCDANQSTEADDHRRDLPTKGKHFNLPGFLLFGPYAHKPEVHLCVQ